MVMTGTATGLQQGTSTYGFDNNNHISANGVTYDALGNVTNDGFHTYTYDAESRLIKVDGNASLTYQYDAAGAASPCANI